MRISHRSKFIFLSNPKCASSSIRGILDPYSDIVKIPELKYPWTPHVGAKDLKEYFHKIGWDWTKYFKFTTVRNPWDRMVSQYFFGRSYTRSVWHKITTTVDFKSFIHHPRVYQKYAKIHNIKAFTCDNRGNCLIDSIIKMEEIDQALEPILKKINISVKNVPKRNITSHDYYRKYYDEKTKKRVAELFKDDIAMFNYTF